MTTDVNVAFANEKLGQIAAAEGAVAANRAAIADYDAGLTQAALDAKLAQDVADGKVELIGQDRYRVLVGFDANETFRIQRASRPNEIALVLPETGLDYVDGKAQLFTAVPAWHSEGIVAQGVTSVAKLLQLAGLAWRVEKTPAFYYAGGELREAPDEFMTYRDDTFAKLGHVGKIYKAFQNAEGAAFLQDLVDRYDVQFESAGTLNGGKQVFISMKLPDTVRIDAEGVNDIVEPFVCWLNSHNGEGKLNLVATPWRPVCGNTNRFAVRDAVTRWGIRHTTNGLDRLEEARRSLGLTVNYFEKFAAEETTLARTPYTNAEFDELIASLWEPAEEPTKRQANAEAKRADALHAGFAVEVGRVGRTAYAAEQAVTDYLDHVAPRRAVGDKLAAARATAILTGADDDIKAKAHRQLLTLKVR